MTGPVMARVKAAVFALRVLHSEGFFTCSMAANFHAYSLPSTLHQVEILRYYRAYLGMSTAPGDSECLPTLRYRANDPGPSSPPENTSPMIPAPISPTLVILLSKLQCMVHSNKFIHTMWLPKGMNLQDAHCSLYCTVSWFAAMPTLTKTSHAAAPRPIPVLLQPLLSRNPGQGQLRF